MTPEELDKALEQLYFSAQSASSEGLKEEALRKCQEALQLLETHGEETERHSFADFVMLTGDVYWGAGEYEEAYQAYHKVALNDPERSDARIAMGVALFHLCRFVASQTMLEMASVDETEDPETWYYLGLHALRRGQRRAAMSHFETAHELQDNRFFVPVEISDEDIVGIVQHLLGDLPAELHNALTNVPVIMEQSPSEELLFSADPPLDPLVLGLFDGTPITEMSSMDVVTSPTRIVLFLDNIWLLGYDRSVLEEELWITLKHEIGHYFGLNEEELAERGLE
ncbi:hypothetical protein BH09SUM1_BH09SUM1_07140 [soil metagenome]